MDDTRSFYLADVEIVDDREEAPLDADLQEQAMSMSNLLPGLVQDWLKLVFEQEKSDVPTMRKRMEVSLSVL